MKKICILTLVFVFTGLTLQAQTTENDQEQPKRNAIGLEAVDGLTFKRYYNQFALEYNLGISHAGLLDWVPTHQFLIIYQPFQSKAFQPFLGLGMYNLVGKYDDGIERLFGQAVDRSNQFHLGGVAKIGFDIIPARSRLSYTLDLGIGLGKNVAKDREPVRMSTLGVGVRYHF